MNPKPDFEKAAKDLYGYGEHLEMDAFLAGCEHAYNLPKWISVKDQLPEYMQVVLIYDIIGFVTMAQYTGERDIFTVSDCYHQASHWQPLPESPKPLIKSLRI